MKDFELLCYYADHTDKFRDPICAHILKEFPHYLSLENRLLIRQLILLGKLIFCDMQKVENFHKNYKFRWLVQRGYAHNWA